MASTIVLIDQDELDLPVLAVLETTAGGQVSPNAAGYAMTLTTAGLYSITVTEACLGIYRIVTKNGDGIEVGYGYVWIQADDAGPYRADASYVFCEQQSINLESRLAELDPANLPSTTDQILADTNEMQLDLANGGRLDLIFDAILEDTGTTLPATLSSMIVTLGSILTDTGELQTDWTDGGRLDLLIDAILDDTENEIPTTLTVISAAVSSIVNDTNELQLDWTDGGRLDLLLDSVVTSTGTTTPATLATINTNSATAAAQVVKIPRCADDLTAGQEAVYTDEEDNSYTLAITISS